MAVNGADHTRFGALVEFNGCRGRFVSITPSSDGRTSRLRFVSDEEPPVSGEIVGQAVTDNVQAVFEPVPGMNIETARLKAVILNLLSEGVNAVDTRDHIRRVLLGGRYMVPDNLVVSNGRVFVDFVPQGNVTPIKVELLGAAKSRRQQITVLVQDN